MKYDEKVTTMKKSTSQKLIVVKKKKSASYQSVVPTSEALKTRKNEEILIENKS
jgi:hypothetical protein